MQERGDFTFEEKNEKWRKCPFQATIQGKLKKTVSDSLLPCYRDFQAFVEVYVPCFM